MLDINGRVLHHMVVAHAADTVYLDTEPGDVPRAAGLPAEDGVLVEGGAARRHRRARGAERRRPGHRRGARRGRRRRPGAPARRARRCPAAGFVRRMAWPGADAADLLVPRAAHGRVVGAAAPRPAPARPARMAFEALRVEALRPRLGVDTDDRTIPHEVGWIGSAVHLTKGCYRGQETVARVANLGRPPRRLVLLHLDAGDEHLPVTGDPVLRDGRAGRPGRHRGACTTSWARWRWRWSSARCRWTPSWWPARTTAPPRPAIDPRLGPAGGRRPRPPAAPPRSAAASALTRPRPPEPRLHRAATRRIRSRLGAAAATPIRESGSECGESRSECGQVGPDDATSQHVGGLSRSRDAA